MDAIYGRLFKAELETLDRKSDTVVVRGPNALDFGLVRSGTVFYFGHVKAIISKNINLLYTYK